ncbi:metal ABC transporter ATP-binding protein [Orrella marina]|uniref:ABC transporter n=1 Tax=Orrella marina TaxID=2163011 RepID=A0A2R4XLA4_9BURK|nr:metal ABC transporter ATP-binding protein [Orrella marina]AWB34573.1 ABC transporter [Orrella marina]
MSCGIELEDVTLAYRGHPAVHHVSGRFDTGSLTAIIGPNGAGKSTLLGAMAGTRKLTQGSIRFVSTSDGPGEDLAYLAQLSGINHDFPLRVLEVVAMGAWNRIGSFGEVTAELEIQIDAALTQVGLQGFEDRLVDELSVGQLQRVLFARLIVQDAPMILLDEPFNALDAQTTQDLLGVINHWHRDGRTVIAVLHDLQMVRDFFPNTLLLARELIAWGPTREVLVPALLQRAQGSRLAWQEAAPWCREPQIPLDAVSGSTHDHHQHDHHSHHSHGAQLVESGEGNGDGQRVTKVIAP